MVRNAASELENRDSKVSALLSGGFHTKGITKLLREKGYSYIVISPYSSTDIDEENYRYLLSGKRRSIEELIKQLDFSNVVKELASSLRVPLIFDDDIRKAYNTFAEKNGLLKIEDLSWKFALAFLAYSPKALKRYTPKNPVCNISLRFLPGTKEVIYRLRRRGKWYKKADFLKIDKEGNVRIVGKKEFNEAPVKILDIRKKRGGKVKVLVDRAPRVPRKKSPNPLGVKNGKNIEFHYERPAKKLPVYTSNRDFVLPEHINNTITSYGLSLDNVTFRQVSGVVRDDNRDPLNDNTVTLPLEVANMAALSAYFNRGCAIDPETGRMFPDAEQRKNIADGGAVTVLEKTLTDLAEDLDIIIIIGGSEGKTRDDAPALEVKQVINPGGKNGIYIVHADPIENTNAEAVDKPGAWALFFLTRLPKDSEVLLKNAVKEEGINLEEFLRNKSGQELAKYGIPFCHDRYVISVSYPGNAKAEKPAEFNPTDDLIEILKKIAEEHNISLEELGRKTHVVFLKGLRTRHTYIEDALKKLQDAGNQITYTTVDDGDAFPRDMASLGLPTYKGKDWSIVFGASGAVEAFGTGLASAGRKSSDGRLIGRVRMVHSSKNIAGNDLSEWNRYDPNDLEDFNSLGITNPSNVITERELSVYPERVFVASSITGAREDIDLTSEMPLSGIVTRGDNIEVRSFLTDRFGRSFIVTVTYKTKDLKTTTLALKADNDYGFLDGQDNSVRDYATKKLLSAQTDEERRLWEERLRNNSLPSGGGLTTEGFRPQLPKDKVASIVKDASSSKKGIKLQIFPNNDALSKRAAAILVAEIKKKPNFVLGCATGSSPILLYDYLIRSFEDDAVDFSKVKTINLDENGGLPPTHPQSYRYFMNKHLFNLICNELTSDKLRRWGIDDSENRSMKDKDRDKAFETLRISLIAYFKSDFVGGNGKVETKLSEETIKDFLTLTKQVLKKSKLFKDNKKIKEILANMKKGISVIHKGLDMANTHVLSGVTDNPEKECEAFEKIIKEAGGIDTQILGIGGDGHIAFNEPIVLKKKASLTSPPFTKNKIRDFNEFDLATVPFSELGDTITVMLKIRKEERDRPILEDYIFKNANRVRSDYKTPPLPREGAGLEELAKKLSTQKMTFYVLGLDAKAIARLAKDIEPIAGNIAFEIKDADGIKDLRTRKVELALPSVIDNLRDYDRFSKSPTWALTMGTGSIMDAGEIILIANTPGKAKPVVASIEGPVSSEVQASYLQEHPDVTFLLTKEAAKSLKKSERLASGETLIKLSEEELENALSQVAASYKINGEPIVARDRRNLVRNLFKLGWLGDTFKKGYELGSNSYDFKLDYDKISIVGFSGDYAEKNSDSFVNDVKSLEGGKIAVVITNNDLQKANLEESDKIKAAGLGTKIFVVKIRRLSNADRQWKKLLTDKDMFDFSNFSTVKDIVNNKSLIKALATAK